jgi:hypothetical protein
MSNRAGHIALGLGLLCGLAACREGPVVAASGPAEPAATGCLANGEGQLQASLRGALEADLAWTNAQMQCDGELRPDGAGLRITIAGPLQPAPGSKTDPAGLAGAGLAHQLRFIFGIDLTDTASGPVQALPTNLTVIVEGGNLLYATRGDSLCAVEDLAREPIGAGIDRVTVNGYCIGPASDLVGKTRLHVPTFSFTALLRTVEQDGNLARN